MRFKLGQSVRLYFENGASVTAKPSFHPGPNVGEMVATLYTDGGETLRTISEAKRIYTTKDDRILTVDPPGTETHTAGA
jgi:hypothetical protein